MAITMSKELLIRVPAPLYRRIKEVCAREYKSMSAFVRELINERVDEVLSAQDLKDIKSARQEFKGGKSVSWRKLKRG